MYISTSSLISLSSIIPAIAAQFQDSAPTLTLDAGIVAGRETTIPNALTNTEVSIHEYLGIPFAKAPIGELRFAPPEVIDSWDDVRNATVQPRSCPQPLRDSEAASNAVNEAYLETIGLANLSSDEDCLYLNVYAPTGGSSDKPVLFWIYGGSGVAGGIEQDWYDGGSLVASQDIILVTANYRLNVFGNPRLPQVPLDERNVGLLDQRMALDWVQRNVKAFGGDPEKVTIAGESAGAVAVGHLINTMSDNPPFRAAILQSGSAVFKPPPNPMNNDTRAWSDLMQRIDCRDDDNGEAELSCARAASMESIQRAMGQMATPFDDYAWDNVTTLEYPATAWLQGRVARVPILIGSTAQDGSIFTLGAGDDVAAFVRSTLGDGPEAKLVTSLYAPNTTATQGLQTSEEIIAQITTDLLFRCSSGFAANLTSTLLNESVWQYVFDAVVPGSDLGADLGAYHASEIPFIFGTYHGENASSVEASLSRSLQTQWADFIKNPDQGPGWEAWPQVATLGMTDSRATTTTKHVNEEAPVCQAWNQLYLALFMDPFALGDASVEDGSMGTSSTGNDSNVNVDIEEQSVASRLSNYTPIVFAVSMVFSAMAMSI